MIQTGAAEASPASQSRLVSLAQHVRALQGDPSIQPMAHLGTFIISATLWVNQTGFSSDATWRPLTKSCLSRPPPSCERALKIVQVPEGAPSASCRYWRQVSKRRQQQRIQQSTLRQQEGQQQ